jgi:hypothetical protein
MAIDNVSLVRFRGLTPAEVTDKMINGKLGQSNLDGYVELNTDHTSSRAKLSEFSFFGTPINVTEEYVENDNATYLLLFTTGTVALVGSRMLTFLTPKAQSANTAVDMSPGCGALAFEADLSSLKPVAILKAGPWVVDFSTITRDGQGNPIDHMDIDGAQLGFYEGKTVAQLQAQAMDLALIATSIWEIQLLGGRTANLADAVNTSDASPFSGFTQNGTWLLSLTCGTCYKPAPIVLTVLVPVAHGKSFVPHHHVDG